MKSEPKTEPAANAAVPSDALVLFGVTGDLAHKKILPALYAMEKRGEPELPLIGVASSPWSLDRLRERAEEEGPYEGLLGAAMEGGGQSPA